MTITLGNATLCAGEARSVNGSPVGPANLSLALTPGVILHEYVGADRVAGEHVRCDHGTVSFQVERIYASPEAALAYIRGDFLAEASEGELKFGSATVFANAVVTSRRVGVVGCAVAVNYTIEG